MNHYHRHVIISANLLLTIVSAFIYLSGQCHGRDSVWTEDKCHYDCPATYDPVCGTDNKTYRNICLLMKATCMDQDVMMAYKGECGASGPVSHTQDENESKNNPSCSSDHCPDVMLPICGSNGVTYNNICEWQRDVCKGFKVELAHGGVCRKQNQPSRLICNDRCPFIRRLVCGTDGITYRNECFFNRETICKGQRVTIAYYRACDDRRSASAPTSRRAAGKSDHERFSLLWPRPKPPRFCPPPPTCPEPKPCPHEHHPEPYPHPAHPNPVFVPLYIPVPGSIDNIDGPCDPNCPDEEDEPFCGTNGQSFGNKCQMEFFQCLGIKVEKAYDGECKKKPK